MEPISVDGPIITGKGTYTEVTDIFGPSKVIPGSRVDITARIKNLYSSTIGILVGGALEYGVSPRPGVTFPSDQANVSGGASHDFAGYFTMPSKTVRLHVYSYYYGSDGTWHFDDERVVTIEILTGAEFRNLNVSYSRV